MDKKSIKTLCTFLGEQVGNFLRFFCETTYGNN